MKYCTKCGNKINEDSKFCSKCGTPTRIELERREEERKRIKETKKDNALLYLGSGLIILASIIFAFTNWDNMSNLFKIIFLSVEMIIFLSISIFSKKSSKTMSYKMAWFVGILFVPIILNLIGEYYIIGNYLSYVGAGLFVYLSISSIICALVYYLSYKYTNLKILMYIGHLFSYLTIIFILSIRYELMNDFNVLILCAINLIIVVICSKVKNNFTKSLNNLMSVILLVLSLIFFVDSYYYDTYNLSMILFVSAGIIHTITTLLFIKLNNKNAMIYIYPYLVYLLVYGYTSCILQQNLNIFIFVSSILLIALYFIFSLYNNKVIKITSFILTIIFVTFTLLFETIGDKVILVLSIIFFITSLFIYKINDRGFEKQICKILFPITLLMFISSVARMFVDLQYSVLYIIVSVICFSIYTILSCKNDNKKLSITFECFSYIFLGFSSILIIFKDAHNITFIVNEIVWLYYLISGMFTKKMISKNVFLLVVVILNLFVGSIRFDMPLYYSILFISLIFVLLDIVSVKLKIKGESVYFYISLLFVIFATMFNFIGYSILSVCMNVLIYCVVYYILIKRKVPFAIKYVYTLFGFCLINRLFNYFIDQSVIENIITLIVYIIIITSMFLLETDSDSRVLSYTPVIIFPYSYLVSNIEIFKSFETELIVLLLVTLVFTFIEKVFSFKHDKDKTLLEIILISFIHINTIYTSIIFNLLFAIFYIFFGVFKKRDSFIILGIVMMILSVFINLFEIIDNLSITYILLGIGIILVTYAFIREARKNNK